MKREKVRIMIPLTETTDSDVKQTEDIRPSVPMAEPGKAGPGPRESTADIEETLYLLGRPTLKQYLRFVRNNAVDIPDRGRLTDEWNAAHDAITVLGQDEAGAADNPPITRLGPAYDSLLIDLLKDPLIQNGFNTVPTEIALIDLGRVVVYQKHIDLTFAAKLREKLGPTPSREQIFRACLPYNHPQPPVKWSRMHRNSFVFVSPSNDMRYLGAMELRRDHIRGYAPPGDLVGIIGLAVGFGSNFLNAFYSDNRIVLHNGSHRAYTLWGMGITHVPCIIQHVSNKHELQAVAASEILEDPSYYLKHPRPPMLKDYFNPNLFKIVKTHRRTRQVTVKFEIDEGFIPTL